MKKSILLLLILVFGKWGYAQTPEFVSVQELNEVLEDYYRNLNILCDSNASAYEKSQADISLVSILTSQLPTNLFCEYLPPSASQNLIIEQAVDSYLNGAKDSIEKWEYKILHFNSKYVPIDTSLVYNQRTNYTAQLLVRVTCLNKRSYCRRFLEYSEINSKVGFWKLFSNVERFSFVKNYEGVWRIFKTERVGYLKPWAWDLDEGEELFDPKEQFSKFKYQYAEFLNPAVYGHDTMRYECSIVHDASKKVGLVNLVGHEYVPAVFDSIELDSCRLYIKQPRQVIKDRRIFAYRDGVRYIIRQWTCEGMNADLLSVSYFDKWGSSIPAHSNERNITELTQHDWSWVSDKPVSWGLWLKVMGGKLPKGSTLDEPVVGVGMHEVDIDDFLIRLRKFSPDDVATKISILKPDECAMIRRNNSYLWLAAPEPFYIHVCCEETNLYNRKTKQVNFSKGRDDDYDRLPSGPSIYYNHGVYVGSRNRY